MSFLKPALSTTGLCKIAAATALVLLMPLQAAHAGKPAPDLIGSEHNSGAFQRLVTLDNTQPGLSWQQMCVSANISSLAGTDNCGRQQSAPSEDDFGPAQLQEMFQVMAAGYSTQLRAGLL